MAAHGVSFVRTGVWMSNDHFIEAATGGANERFLRNLEAFLDCARRHQIAVTSPSSRSRRTRGRWLKMRPRFREPYTDAGSVNAEQAYVRSVVERFKDVPWLSWDLINEPSFSNPKQIFSRQCSQRRPMDDRQRGISGSAEICSVPALADAWRVTAKLG